MIRLSLAVPTEVRGRLESLRDETGADSLTEVIRRSLATYEFLWQQAEAGKEFFVRDAAGNETPVHFVWA